MHAIAWIRNFFKSLAIKRIRLDSEADGVPSTNKKQLYPQLSGSFIQTFSLKKAIFIYVFKSYKIMKNIPVFL